MAMKLGLGLYHDMLTPDYVRFAKQAGATHIVAHMPGEFTRDANMVSTSDDGTRGFGVARPSDPIWTYEGLRDLKAMINAGGLELVALENFAPQHWYDVLLDGPRKRAQMEHLKSILRDMGRVGIPIMGYNFSIAGVWGRVEGPFARGGAVSVGYENPSQPPIPNRQAELKTLLLWPNAMLYSPLVRIRTSIENNRVRWAAAERHPVAPL